MKKYMFVIMITMLSHIHVYGAAALPAGDPLAISAAAAAAPSAAAAALLLTQQREAALKAAVLAAVPALPPPLVDIVVSYTDPLLSTVPLSTHSSSLHSVKVFYWGDKMFAHTLDITPNNTSRYIHQCEIRDMMRPGTVISTPTLSDFASSWLNPKNKGYGVRQSGPLLLFYPGVHEKKEANMDLGMEVAIVDLRSLEVSHRRLAGITHTIPPHSLDIVNTSAEFFVWGGKNGKTSTFDVFSLADLLLDPTPATLHPPSRQLSIDFPPCPDSRYQDYRVSLHVSGDALYATHAYGAVHIGTERQFFPDVCISRTNPYGPGIVFFDDVENSNILYPRGLSELAIPIRIPAKYPPRKDGVFLGHDPGALLYPHEEKNGVVVYTRSPQDSDHLYFDRNPGVVYLVYQRKGEYDKLYVSRTPHAAAPTLLEDWPAYAIPDAVISNVIDAGDALLILSTVGEIRYLTRYIKNDDNRKSNLAERAFREGK